MKDKVTDLIKAHPGRRINYERFMETVLYDREQGYYMKPTAKIGKKGDFYTGPSVHPVFGYTMARFFVRLVEKENLPPVVCEIGAGDGRFAGAVLEEWKRLSPSTYKNVRYFAVEASPFHRREQSKHLPETGRFISYAGLGELKEDEPRFCGILFFNELLDAFPVRVVKKRGQTLHEAKITLNDRGELTEILEPCRDERIFHWLKTYGFTLADGQRIEIPLVMTNWLKGLANWLERGAVLSVDYGYTEEEWRQPAKREGSLRGYHHHRLVRNPLLYPGEMDLTSHVHLGAVEKIAEEAGLDHFFTIPQREFLLAAGILDNLREQKGSDPFSHVHRQNRAIGSLISGGMGSAFHVQFQGKELSPEPAEDWLAANPVEHAVNQAIKKDDECHRLL